MPAIAPTDDVAFLIATSDTTFTLDDGSTDGHVLMIGVNQVVTIGAVTVDIAHLSTTGTAGSIVAPSGSPAGAVLVWNHSAGYWNIVSLLGFGVA